MQISVLASTLRRIVEGVPHQLKGMTIYERSVFSAIHVFLKKLMMEKMLSPEEEEVMACIASSARALEERLGGRPQLYVFIESDPETCYCRLNRRSQPDDDKIRLSELRALELLHRQMMRAVVADGATVAVVERVPTIERTEQMHELAGFMTDMAQGKEGKASFNHITVIKPTQKLEVRAAINNLEFN